MTETKGNYVTKRRDLSTSTDELEREMSIEVRLKKLGRDEREVSKLLAGRVADLEAALDKAKQRELTILGWLQDANAAKAIEV